MDLCVWGWAKPAHQMCALGDNEHHQGMGEGYRGVLDRGWGRNLRTRAEEESLVPFHSSPDASGSKHIYNKGQSHQGCEGKI